MAPFFMIKVNRPNLGHAQTEGVCATYLSPHHTHTTPLTNTHACTHTHAHTHTHTHTHMHTHTYMHAHTHTP